MEGINSGPRIILFELRTLVREGIYASLQAQGYNVVSCFSLEHLTEELCFPAEDRKILLAGAGGLGALLPGMLRTLRFTQTMSLTSVVYFPHEDTLLAKLFAAAGAHHCLVEDALDSRLDALISTPFIKEKDRPRLSPAELNVLLDYAAGMDTREIAQRRNCNYKTVFTFKRNVCVRLDVETKSGWAKLLSSLSQLTSIYE